MESLPRPNTSRSTITSKRISVGIDRGSRAGEVHLHALVVARVDAGVKAVVAVGEPNLAGAAVDDPEMRDGVSDRRYSS